MSKIAKFILYKLWGWKIVGTFPKEVKKYVLIAAPHTHWLDFPLAMLVKYSTKEPINFIAKKSLFKFPLGIIMRAFGGMPVDRSKSNDTVDAIAQIFDKNEEFILALSPEGTRKKVTKWKTGFYYIAKKANVPIVMATLNFKEKEVKIATPYYPTNNKEEDFNFLQSYFKGVVGKIPEYS